MIRRILPSSFRFADGSIDWAEVGFKAFIGLFATALIALIGFIVVIACIAAGLWSLIAIPILAVSFVVGHFVVEWMES